MRKLIIVLLMAVSVAYCVQRRDGLDGIIESRKASFLNLPQKLLFSELNEKCGLTKIQWGNEAHTQARYARSIVDEQITFCSFPVVEVVFNFTDKLRLDSCHISIYNRGDCGAWPMDRFETTQKELAAAISAFTKKRQPVLSKRKLNKARLQQLLWRTPWYDLALRWCATDDSTEYITVNVEQRGTIQDLRDDMKTDVKTRELMGQVKKDVKGERWIDVPMVNQGDKGYCVVAVMERLFKYYNSSLDQHILAQIMSADPLMGTALERGMDAIKSNAGKLRISVRELERFADDDFNTVNNFEKFVNDYNRQASKQKLPKIEWKNIARTGYDVRQFIGMADGDLFMAMRGKRRPGVKAFLQSVKDSIDKGIPLAWSVIILPRQVQEQPMASFHLRLINGYNEKTNEIIYTDSWGYGHEHKRMDISQAWAITKRMYIIKPK